MSSVPAWRVAPIDHRRLLRVVARYRAIGHSDDGAIVVGGGRELHTVYLRDDIEHACDCADHCFRDSLCVHVIAALLFTGDERVVRALGDVMRDTWLNRPPPLPSVQHGLIDV